MNISLSEGQIAWLETLYKAREKQRTATTVPERMFDSLKALRCVEGTPSSTCLTAHGAGVLIAIRREAEAAKKAARRSKHVH